MLSRLSLVLSSLIIFASCSSLVESTRKTLLGDDSPRSKTKKEVKWVSKTQYDDLMGKYKNLTNKYEKVKEDKYTQGGGFDQVSEMTNNSSPETVDVFGRNGIVNKKKEKRLTINKSSLEEELVYYRKAVALKENKKVDEALKIFQFLENSNSKQVKIRAKRFIGDIYLSKNQFDLALQVYEDMIKQNAFSGSTLKALENAAKCADKLGLTDKKAQYESLLRDVFEVQV
jgi:tetratricopeptide (TPR) repeat protein